MIKVLNKYGCIHFAKYSITRHKKNQGDLSIDCSFSLIYLILLLQTDEVLSSRLFNREILTFNSEKFPNGFSVKNENIIRSWLRRENGQNTAYMSILRNIFVFKIKTRNGTIKILEHRNMPIVEALILVQNRVEKLRVSPNLNFVLFCGQNLFTKFIKFIRNTTSLHLAGSDQSCE